MLFLLWPSCPGPPVTNRAKCSILFDKATHISGLKPECTVCLQAWSSHTWGKHIPKNCKFCWQQALGDTATDDLEPAEDRDVHSRLAHIMQENQVIKAQLSQLMELVWQLLPQPGQATPQPAEAGSSPAPPPPADEQAVGTSGANVGLPPPLWLHTGEPAPGVSLGGHQPPLPSHASNSQCYSMAILCQQCQWHWHHLPGRCPLQMLNHSNPGLPRSAPACQSWGQHPVFSRCHQPLAYLWHRSPLQSEGGSSTVSMWISLSCWHMISNTGTLAWTTARP